MYQGASTIPRIRRPMAVYQLAQKKTVGFVGLYSRPLPLYSTEKVKVKSEGACFEGLRSN
jgi:hypothetical protein